MNEAEHCNDAFCYFVVCTGKRNGLVTKSTWNMSWINSTEVLDNISYLKRCH